MIKLRRCRLDAQARVSRMKLASLTPTDAFVVDPRTGAAPATWDRVEELLVGESLRAATKNECAPSSDAWSRALV